MSNEDVHRMSDEEGDSGEIRARAESDDMIYTKDTGSTFSSRPSSPVLDEEDAEERLSKSRERNREHARRTRLRKKAQLEALQTMLVDLQNKNRVLKQNVKMCSIASILIGLSSGSQSASDDDVADSALVEDKSDSLPMTPVNGKRKRFVSECSEEPVPHQLKLTIKGKTTIIGGGKTHINWKSGVYCDENGVQQQLTQEQLKVLRRERNRMHAKMTRDRKKSFISSIKNAITRLESENKELHETLARQAEHHFVGQKITPSSSPLLAAMVAPVSTPSLSDAEDYILQSSVDYNVVA
eukprot:scaffold19232_cov50-Attheya_sp.AAC.9